MNKTLLLLLLALPGFCLAQLTAKPIEPGRAIGFYQFLPQGYDPNGSYKYPLIINMHGAAEKGNGTSDLPLVLTRSLGEMIVQQHATLKFNFDGKRADFIALIPQLAPVYDDWMEFHVDSMINYAINNLNVDANKIFLSGYSLGGGGAWMYPSYSVENARKIAGIFPASGSPGYKDFDICNIARGNVPVWAHHSENDDAVPIIVAKTGVNGVNACSPSIPALSTYYETGGHGLPWLASLDTLHNYQYPNMWQWMAATTRLNTPDNNQAPIANAGTDITLALPLTSTVLNGLASRDPNDIIVKYEWTKTAGPNDFMIEKPNYPSTTLTNLQFGTYTFQIKVTDQFGVVRTDDVIVNVTSALPVGLSYFKGKTSGKFNNLTWAVSTEINLDRFEVLRSTDGTNFTVIGSSRAGNSTYSFTDEKAPAGKSFYRLKNVDKDGTISYSEIITINNTSPAVVIVKYPNPVKNELTLVVQGAVTGKLDISIHNFEGKLVRSLTVTKTDLSWQGTIKVSNLQKGIYSIQVQKPGVMKESSSFVKD